jgi:hypothetical protein
LLLALSRICVLGFKSHGAHDGLGRLSHCLAVDVFTVLCWLHYSGFQALYHNVFIFLLLHQHGIYYI